MSDRDDDFFVGYLATVPRVLRPVLTGVAVLLIAGAAALSLLLASTQNDAGPGGFQWDAGEQQITGVLTAKPYPVIHVPPSRAFPAGHTYLLSGEGKRGVQDAASPLDGQVVEAGGFLIKRGSLDMLQVGGAVGLRRPALASDTAAVRAPAPVDLGRWRLRGEICDGKCYAGAMRPGTGLAHKACANLCLIGGAPPVLVTADPIFLAGGSGAGPDATGTSFLLIGAHDGAALGPEILDHVAVPVEVEGRIERRGDLAVFLLDPATLRVR